MSGNTCHSCGAPSLRSVAEFQHLHRVTSDCRPWPGRGELAVCAACGLVQKPVDASWQRESTAIYADYHMYRQAADEAEQRVASDAGFEKRSDVLLAWAKANVPLRDSGRYLDFGCGNGATLRSAAKALPGWEIYGNEPHARDPAAIRAIPGVRDLLSALDGQEASFDFITMMHVIEHIPDPSKALRDIAGLIAPGVRLFIEVPYFIDSPYELTVADHCSHFTMRSLTDVVERAGIAVVDVSVSVLKREITLVAARGERAVAETASPWLADVESAAKAAGDQIAWLSRVVEDARASVRRPFGIFGTAIAGTWLFSHLAETTDFFVDEDASRAGKLFLDRPVYLPCDVPAGATVYVALIPELAQKIGARHARLPVDWRMPPDWFRPEVEARCGAPVQVDGRYA